MVAGNEERRWWLVFLKYHRSKNKRVVLEEEDQWVSMVVVVWPYDVGRWCYSPLEVVERWCCGRRRKLSLSLSLSLSVYVKVKVGEEKREIKTSLIGGFCKQKLEIQAIHVAFAGFPHKFAGFAICQGFFVPYILPRLL
jgi:hypothetical protein